MPGFPKNRFNGSIGDSSRVACPELMEMEEKRVAGRSKRLSELFFLQKVLLEKSGDSSALTTLALSVHAIMLESGFVLLDSCFGKFSFSEELLSVSLKYTLPELIKISRKENKKFDYVTVIFRKLGCVVVVNGNLNGYSQTVHKTYLDKRRFLSVIHLVVDTLKFEKQVSSIFYRDVFVLWRMVKDNLVLPLLIDLCDKTGLESPPCLMSLPTELKLKILESLPGVSIGKMACVCKEMRNLTSNNDLWKQKYVEERLDRYDRTLTGEVDWKKAYAQFWWNKRLPVLEKPKYIYTQLLRNKRLPFSLERQNFTRDRYSLFGEDLPIEYIKVRQVKRSRASGQRFAGRLNLGGHHWEA